MKRVLAIVTTALLAGMIATAAGIRRSAGSAPSSSTGMIKVSVTQPITNAEAIIATAKSDDPISAMPKDNGWARTKRPMRRNPSRKTAPGVSWLNDMTAHRTYNFKCASSQTGKRTERHIEEPDSD